MSVTLEDPARVRLDGPALVAVGLGLVFWSSAFPGISYGLAVFTPGELALFRYLVASLCFGLAATFRLIRLPPRRDWPAVFLLGLVGVAAYQILLGQAMTRITSGAAAVIIALAPGVTAALAAWRLKEPVGPNMAAGLAIAFAGVVVVTLGAGREVRFEPRALLALGAVLSTSAYFVWQKPLLRRCTPLGLTAATAFAGTVGLVPFGVGLPAALARAPAPQIWSGIFLGVVPTVLGYAAVTYALSRAPASRVMSYFYLQPVVTCLVAWAWLGQVPTVLTVAGGSVALVGVALTNRKTA